MLFAHTTNPDGPTVNNLTGVNMNTIKIGTKILDYSSMVRGIQTGTVVSIKGNKVGIKDGAAFWVTPIKHLEPQTEANRKYWS